jgi:hypothetical protein
MKQSGVRSCSIEPAGGSRPQFGRFSQDGIYLVFCIALALALGLWVRIPHFLTTSFPLNDGGFFMPIIEGIRQNHYLLPAFINYNHTAIPFAYPPLGFYLAIFVSNMLGVPDLYVLRYLPLVLNLISVCVFVILAAELLPSRAALLYASLAFPLLWGSYKWYIMGAGITRSPGLLFTLLAIYCAQRLTVSGRRRALIGCLIFICLAGLSHLEWGLSGSAAVACLIFTRWPNFRGIKTILSIAILGVILSSPWWMAVVARFGLEPFSNAKYWSFADRFKSLANFDFLSQTYYLGWLMLVGGSLCLIERKWFLPLWYLSTWFLTQAHGWHAALAPLVLMSALGLDFLIARIFAAVAGLKLWAGLRCSRNSCLTGGYRPYFVAILLVGYLWIMYGNSFYTPIGAVSPGQRVVMTWIRENTSPKSQFVLLTPSSTWSEDYLAEWFPYLTERESLVTAQGLEWMPKRAFGRMVEQISQLKAVQSNYPQGLAGYVGERFESSDYVAVFLPGIGASYGGFLESGRYRVVYQDEAALIFQTVDPAVR